MKNLFCDYQLAKMLDELGLKEKCLGTYLGFGNGEMREDNPKIYKTTEPELFISGQFPSSEDKEEELQMSAFGFCHAPLWQQVEEWLWNKHKIWIKLWRDLDSNPKNTFHELEFQVLRLNDTDAEELSCSVLLELHFNNPIITKNEGIKKAVEYLYEEHHKTKVL